MSNIITTNDAKALQALSPQLKNLIYRSAKSLKNITGICYNTSKENKQLTPETKEYWSVLINHAETLEMFFITDDAVNAIV